MKCFGKDEMEIVDGIDFIIVSSGEFDDSPEQTILLDKIDTGMNTILLFVCKERENGIRDYFGRVVACM